MTESHSNEQATIIIFSDSLATFASFNGSNFVDFFIGNIWCQNRLFTFPQVCDCHAEFLFSAPNILPYQQQHRLKPELS